MAKHMRKHVKHMRHTFGRDLLRRLSTAGGLNLGLLLKPIGRLL